MAHLVASVCNRRSAAIGRLVSICLGVAATATSLLITVIAGEERGATWAEKTVWITTGGVILLAAHLLPALTRGARVSVKSMVLPVWIGALLATGYTHATFFLNAQERVGSQRAVAVAAMAQVFPPPAAPRVRSRTQIADDAATTLRNLALLGARRCNTDCAVLAAQRKALSARLDALRIEDKEAVRAERYSDAHMAAMDRNQKAQDDARVDPFVADLATFMRLGTNQISLIMAIVLGWLVDAVAVVSWTSVTRPQPGSVSMESASQASIARPDLPPRGVPFAQSHVPQAAANEPLLRERVVAPREGRLGSSDAQAVAASVAEEVKEVIELADLAAAIRTGRVQSTLASIRAHLGCTDGAAMALRRRLAEEYPDLFRPVAFAGCHGG